MAFGHIVRVAQGASLAGRVSHFTSQADPTTSHDESAARLNEAYRQRSNLPPEMSADEIEGDNAEYYLSQVATFASDNIFPINFTVDLQRPPNSTSKRHVTAKTLQGYLGKILKSLRQQFPNHPDWVNLNPQKKDDVPSWWTVMRSDFLDACSRFQRTNAVDAIFGEFDTRPLYKDLSKRRNPNDPHSICDFRTVQINLVKGSNQYNNNLEQGSWLQMTESGVSQEVGR